MDPPVSFRLSDCVFGRNLLQRDVLHGQNKNIDKFWKIENTASMDKVTNIEISQNVYVFDLVQSKLQKKQFLVLFG